MRVKILTPAKGFGMNPLNRGDLRNFKCPCGQPKKVKRCCGQHPCIPLTYIPALAQIVAHYDESGSWTIGRRQAPKKVEAEAVRA